MNERKGWFQTYSGIAYYPHDPRPEEVNIIDIAHHLSHICRFTGAVRNFYSVAEHSIHTSRLVPPEYRLLALMHDAHEAYCNDLASPTKRPLEDYAALEEKNWRAVAMAFNLPFELPDCVKKADRAMLYVEQMALMPAPPIGLTDGTWNKPDLDVSKIEVRNWVPPVAKAAFLMRFRQLTTGD